MSQTLCGQNLIIFSSGTNLSAICHLLKVHVPFFFGYKTELFSLQNKPKVLDLSCKMDLDLWHCLGRVELVL